jgi:hypothetical protein
MADCVPTCSGHVTVDVQGDEAMVYDAGSHTAHALTAAAGRVLERCDGHTAIAELARDLHLHPGELTQIVAELAGLGLVSGGLSSGGLSSGGDGVGLSRRRLLQRGALVGGGIVVASVAVPMAAAHASGDTTPIGGHGVVPGYGEYFVGADSGGARGQTVTVPAGTVITGFSFDHLGTYGSPSTVTFNLWDPGTTAYYPYGAPLGAPVVTVTQPAPPPGTPLSVTFPGHTVTGAGPVTFTVIPDTGIVGMGFTMGAPGLTSVAGSNAFEYANYSAVFTLYGHLGGATQSVRRAAVAQTSTAPTVIASQAATGEKPPVGVKLPGQLRGTRPGGKPGP